jgi:acyl transferase domain-containing protein
MTEANGGLRNSSAKKLALLAQSIRATPHTCFVSEPIAVLGVACRFPGADDPEQFWQALLSGRDAVTEIPRDRWDVEAHYDPDPQAPGKSYSRWGGFLDRVDEFDAAFFAVSPREAQQMDPRQRLLLETAWEALENACLAPERLSGGDAGVFVGHMVGDYYSLQTSNLAGADSHVSTGNLDSILANRLSYALNLRGPSLAVDTACSSSLVAVYLACQSLRQGECQTAIAGGVNLLLTPEMHVLGARSLLLSPDGRSKTFDRGANGFVRGEGCGLVVLRRLADALAAGDPVRAVIRGVAVNQDGKTNGLSAPNGLAQQRVIRLALDNALLDPARVTFVETHGTGTVVGDTVEFEALAEVYGRPSAEGECHLGAVKTNVGHLEAAAGVAGLIKTVLCLRHGRIPPNLHFQERNPHIRMGPTRLRLPLRPTPWPAGAHPRCAAVSSFGLGGTNAHVVLEEAPQEAGPSEAVERPLHLMTLSARDEAALAELARRYDALLQARPEVSLADLAYTANTGRNHFAVRRAVVADDVATLRDRLGQVSPGGSVTRPPPRIAFLFPGEIPSCDQAVRELSASQPAFRRAVQTCEPLDHRPESTLLALEYGLLEVWRSWGIAPELCLGEGVGYGIAEGAGGKRCLAGAGGNSDKSGPMTRKTLVARAREFREQGGDVFLEIGQGSLLDAVRQDVTDPGVLWLRSLDPTGQPWQALLESLVALYQRGATVDWSGFDRGYSRRKVALPNYPFRRQRYWLPGRPAATGEAEKEYLYHLQWRPQPLQEGNGQDLGGDWLIVGRDGGLGEELAAGVRRHGGRVAVAGAFVSPPAGAYRGVVYLCGDAEEADIPASAEAASVGLLHLVQAMTRTGNAARLWVVTGGCQAVTGREAIRLGQAPLWGLARSVRFEHPELQTVCVDLDPSLTDFTPLLSEMRTSGESEVAYRDGMRYVARLVRDDGAPRPAPPIRGDACYLVAGGLGALGLRVARYLVEQGARRLVLAGRSARADHPAVAEVRAGGASVQVVGADVTRGEDVKRLLTTCQSCGPLRGVIHAAGFLDDGVLEKQTAERLVRVLAPKVRGSWELHAQTRDLPLDFFVCFSSRAALLGSPGQSNHAAASAFLDALAHHRRAAGLAGLSINWGPWADASIAPELHARLEAHGEGMIDPATGVRLFARALAGDAPQVAAMPIDWPRYAATYPAPEFLSLLGVRTLGPSLRQRLSEAPPERREELLKDFVQSAVSRVLGHAPGALPGGRGFADLGMDSLGAIELRTHLEQALECRLPATLAFDYPTVEALVAHLRGSLLAVPAAAAPGGTDDLEDLSREELAALLAAELSTPPKGTRP